MLPQIPACPSQTKKKNKRRLYELVFLCQRCQETYGDGINIARAFSQGAPGPRPKTVGKQKLWQNHCIVICQPTQWNVLNVLFLKSCKIMLQWNHGSQIKRNPVQIGAIPLNHKRQLASESFRTGGSNDSNACDRVMEFGIRKSIPKKNNDKIN